MNSHSYSCGLPDDLEGQPALIREVEDVLGVVRRSLWRVQFDGDPVARWAGHGVIKLQPETACARCVSFGVCGLKSWTYRLRLQSVS